ncbi:MAG: phosphoribosylanthranilate isomerase [Planctomycetaceae bacterium]|nr:phosphoribosylanthranilate isomerase [Planctomycetaceae bacterium]
MRIKICGLMRKQDVQWCEELGIDVLGFVVDYPRDVPWNLTRKQAQELISSAKRPTCIVTGGTPESVVSLAQELKPTMVQLHFNETVAQTTEIAAELKKLGIQTTKAVHDDAKIEVLCSTGIDAILVDSRTPGNAAQNNLAVDVDLYRRIKAKAHIPLIIAGGITSENVCDIISCTGANWIDVMTGVEHSPGVKDKMKIEALAERVRGV